MNEMLKARMKSDHIKFAFVPTFYAWTDLDITTYKVSTIFIPLCDKLFEMIHIY